MSNKQLFDEWFAQDQVNPWPEWLESKLLEARAELATGNRLHAQATDKINDKDAEIAALKSSMAKIHEAAEIALTSGRAKMFEQLRFIRSESETK